MDLLGNTSGYHSYESSPLNHRVKQSSSLDPYATEFHMEPESALVSNYQSSSQYNQQFRRSSRLPNYVVQRIATSCKYIGF